jgi:hypothetical protein
MGRPVSHVDSDIDDERFITDLMWVGRSEGIGCLYARQWKLQLSPDSSVVTDVDPNWGHAVVRSGSHEFRVKLDQDAMWGLDMPALTLRAYELEVPHRSRTDRDFDRLVFVDPSEGSPVASNRQRPRSIALDSGDALRSEAEANGGDDPGIQERFHQLLDSWRNSIVFVSSATQIVIDASYQQIIGMGPAVLPLIFQELSKSPDPWGWALKAITGEDPAAGTETLEAAAHQWLDWAQTHGYLLE